MRKSFILLLTGLMLSACLAGCSFFESPPETPGTAAQEPDMTLKEEAAPAPDPQLLQAVSDETWQILAQKYVHLEEVYDELNTMYGATSLVNQDVENLLEQAHTLMTGMGETRRSQITEQDAAELQELMQAMDESMTEIYQNLYAAESMLNPEELPAVELETAEEAAPSEEAEPAADTPPAEEKPAEDEKPAVAPASAETETPVAQPTPDEKETPAAEPKPGEAALPAAKPEPAEKDPAETEPPAEEAPEALPQPRRIFPSPGQ